MSINPCSNPSSLFRRILAASVLAVLALALVMTSAASARDTMRRGEALYRGDQLTSRSGEYLLQFLQQNGNVVLYRKVSPGLKILWQTGTDNVNAERFIFQGDGNIVVYDKASKAVWSPNVNGKGGHRLILQNDGNLVIYTATDKAGISDDHCDLYANEAVKLAVQAETLGVSPGGPRWTQSYKAHYGFCKSGAPAEILFAEHNARVEYLKTHAPKGDSAVEDLLAASLAAIANAK